MVLICEECDGMDDWRRVTVKGREKMAEGAADMPLYLTYRIKCVTVTTQSIS